MQTQTYVQQKNNIYICIYICTFQILHIAVLILYVSHISFTLYCTRIYICTYIYICIYIYIYLCMYIYAYIYIYTHIYNIHKLYIYSVYCCRYLIYHIYYVKFIQRTYSPILYILQLLWIQYMWHILSIFYQNPHIRYIYICSIYIYVKYIYIL